MPLPTAIDDAPTRAEILACLRGDDAAEVAYWLAEADRVRQASVGSIVHLRGLIEVSSHCRRLCTYCGMRAPNRNVKRYRLTPEEILAAARNVVDAGLGTIVLQAGEDPGLTESDIARVIQGIHDMGDVAVTLSLGERNVRELATWRRAGANRYLLRFETSNRKLYRRIHPALRDGQTSRLPILRTLRELGYEVGSGVMVGVPGQTFDDLADDLELFRELDLDMIGVGPYVPDPDTPLGRKTASAGAGPVANDVATVCRVVALARLLLPDSNIPATTALAVLDRKRGYEQALVAGANVVMPNFTPTARREGYRIYPGKAELPGYLDPLFDLEARIRELGRTPGHVRGDSPRFERRRSVPPTMKETDR